jgi:hypothetical protein
MQRRPLHGLSASGLIQLVDELSRGYVDCIDGLEGLALALGDIEGPVGHARDDSLALPDPKAYPTHSGTLTEGLLASFPRRSFTAAS